MAPGKTPHGKQHTSGDKPLAPVGYVIEEHYTLTAKLLVCEDQITPTHASTRKTPHRLTLGVTSRHVLAGLE